MILSSEDQLSSPEVILAIFLRRVLAFKLKIDCLSLRTLVMLVTIAKARWCI